MKSKSVFTEIDTINKYVAAIGALLVLLGLLLPYLIDKLWVFEAETVLLSVGCSIIASSIITYFVSRYQIRRENLQNIIDHWGLENIYSTRAVMNQVCDEKQSQARECIDVMGFGLRSWRQGCTEMIISLLRRGVRIRILTPVPDHLAVRMREESEEDSEGNISKSIHLLKNWVENLKSEGNIELRHYSGLPMDFYFRVDNTLFIGPYLHGRQSQQTISYEYSANGQMFRDYTAYFEEMWRRCERSQ